MKNLKLKKMSVVQTANVAALLYVPLGLVYLLVGFGVFLLSGDMAGAIAFFVMGALLPPIGWVLFALMTLLLNLAYKITGGVTLTFEEK
jgi:hypothetical protein